jgi:sulfur carrier protein
LPDAGRHGRVSAVHITVNGQEREVPDDLTVLGLIGSLGLTEGPVAVERNREVVPRAQHGATKLTGGDVIEIVHLVGGG